jgi:hypothetical protein
VLLSSFLCSNFDDASCQFSGPTARASKGYRPSIGRQRNNVLLCTRFDISELALGISTSSESREKGWNLAPFLSSINVFCAENWATFVGDKTRKTGFLLELFHATALLG